MSEATVSDHTFFHEFVVPAVAFGAAQQRDRAPHICGVTTIFAAKVCGKTQYFEKKLFIPVIVNASEQVIIRDVPPIQFRLKAGPTDD